MNVEKFKTGFAKGDSILHANNQHITEGKTPRYINVWNTIDGKDYTIGDNGERRERVIKNGSVTFGDVCDGSLSYDEVDGNSFKLK